MESMFNAQFGCALAVYWAVIGWFLYGKESLKRNKDYRQQFTDFLYIVDCIRSCGTFQELDTAQKWIERLEYSLPPGARDILGEELKKKMTDLDRELTAQTGGSPKKVQ